MKYLQTLAVVLLAGAASAASAEVADVIVGTEQFCPAGTASKGPAYRWQDGHFVREGWVCSQRQGTHTP